MKPIFLDYDVVRSRRRLGTVVPQGATGAVLMVFATTPPSYEVEFVDSEGASLEILTVIEADLDFVQRAT
jgi:hypothetical protein